MGEGKVGEGGKLRIYWEISKRLQEEDLTR
jgi:hypothetical protein